MNYMLKPTISNNRFLRAIGATSWNDAAVCLLVYSFIFMFIFSLASVFFTLLGAFFSGLIVEKN